MILNIFFLIIGIALVLWGADKFTDGASGIARKWHVSELVIGLTVVAMGTSLPELMVSLFSSLRGSSDMSVGNIVGSNIFNTLTIIGASALMMPVVIQKGVLYRDIPLSFVFALLLFVLSYDGNITLLDAIFLLILFCGFLYYTYYIGTHGQKTSDEVREDTSIWKLLFLLLIGIVCLVSGGQLLVNNAADLARLWGVRESVIGLTILAAGTSLPELATSMVAAKKGSAGLAMGNAIGSNVFNIAFVLGTCSAIRPMVVQDISMVDWAVFIFSNVLLWIFACSKRSLSKLEGLVLVLSYIAYLTYLVLA
ncbi:MAG: calcium/sodium antiporter [Bacteroidaceae bacterium]|nr:calcium/sodium antiporter [Bacteroidaceae bacterium]MBR4526855.1 calcium/sodium antiporter [Bacteroidaceae bacterium]